MKSVEKEKKDKRNQKFLEKTEEKFSSKIQVLWLMINDSKEIIRAEVLLSDAKIMLQPSRMISIFIPIDFVRKKFVKKLSIRIGQNIGHISQKLTFKIEIKFLTSFRNCQN